MYLADLFDPTDLAPATPGSALNPAITGLTADSRAVKPGFLFAALSGSRADGASFIGEAVARGAVAVLCERTAVRPHGAIAVVPHANPRRALARAAARFYPRHPTHLAAVTGTNGKTSVACFTHQLWQAMGRRAGTIGTLGAQWRDRVEPLATTTPDPVQFHALLDRMVGDGVDYVAIEASSHALDQHRVDGATVKSAAFTNLSHDHLDYHPSLAAYFACKTRLFAEVLDSGGTAVLNADVPEAEPLGAVCAKRGVKTLTYGRAGRDIALVDASPSARGQRLALEVDGARHDVALPLVGDFQAANALCALGLAMASGGQAAALAEALAGLSVVPGRLEHAATHANGAPIYVDYAHTPDALAKVLIALRPHAKGRLSVVFGAGGDRDPTKRPRMGAVVARLADTAIVTDDNPRNEDPAAIRRAVLAGCPRAREIADRREAIVAAVAALQPGDVLLIAGKGHEGGQIVAGRVAPFDDREVAREAAARREAVA